MIVNDCPKRQENSTEAGRVRQPVPAVRRLKDDPLIGATAAGHPDRVFAQQNLPARPPPH